MKQEVVHGDFTQMAKNYINRVGYSELVLKNLASYVGIDGKSIIADVGAGTGKLTENLLSLESEKIYAVEPNEQMRQEGINYVKNKKVEWMNGSGEDTNLESNSIDWLLMGSSFHWVDIEKGLKEFSRVLRPGGFFTAIWNPRNINGNPLHEKIENKIYEIVPDMKRVSSGSGKFTEFLFENLISTGDFEDVIYVEAHHNEIMSKERYLGIWKSVNDIRVQAGEEKWSLILKNIEDIIKDYKEIEVPYKSRSWTVKKK
ncbi:MAG: class I SAM-dependent methyltransferase [Patescibacteria group bacterium]|nr:class I SAM-dependent methyltransferase [Patescibacteria group bacterium]